MSRRLDISSLLCDEPPQPPPPPRVRDEIVPEPVLLAPHLRKNQQRDPSFANILHSPVQELPRPQFQRPRYSVEQPNHVHLLQREPQIIHQERFQAHRIWEEHPPPPAPRKSDPAQLRPPSFSPRMHHVEPPSKKRRYSEEVPPAFDAPRSMSFSRSGGDRSILNPEPQPTISPAASNSSADAHPFSFGSRPILDNHPGIGNGQLDGKIQTPLFLPARRSPPGSASGRAKAARKPEPEAPEMTPPYVAERRDYTVIHVPERPREEYVPEEKKHKKTHSSGQPRAVEYRPPQQQDARPQDTRPQGPPQRRSQPLPPASQPKEEDAHEWLLEHYADSSPNEWPRHKPEPPPSPPHVFARQRSVETKRATPPSATMPEAAVALEEELAFVPARVESKTEDVEMGMSNLLVSGASKTEDSSMDVDVEDELLSLVDDRPRSRSITQPPSISRVSSGGHTKRLSNVTEPTSPHASPTPPAFSARASSALPQSERESMPPPASTVSGRSKSKDSSASKKTAKPAPKPKATTAAKPRAKPAPKPRGKAADVTAALAKAKPSAISRKSGSAAASVSRSRSTSAMPGGSVGPDSSEKHEEEEEEPPAEDDKLYCVCKTKYDEDRFMIACDKCDEWYHTQCVGMPDLVVDLVDQFFCPLCIEKNPTLSLKTTYKPRCRYGLDHPEPDSPTACHKPAQGAFSKYCSPECGLNNIKKRIETFTKNGGRKELLWDSVKDAQKREAVVIIHEVVAPGAPEADSDGCTKENAAEARVVASRMKPSMGKVEREVASLNAVLEVVVAQREEVKEGMEIVSWREQLLEFASERAERVGQCGWDQRLCFGEEEWAEFGAGVLESYEEKEGAMQVDGEDWWCLESERCERHSGWQNIRAKDVAKEREKKEEALFRLTTRERELRKRIEDIVEPYNRSCINPSSAALKSSKLVNGNSKGKANGDNKKGKKRKNPS